VTISAPNLDDRTFQDLVDDAKRYVQARCPQWSDHNVSDPGVTLIETFAMMTDQMIYRLNRVPDRLYIQFLNLLGVRLFPPKAAVAPVTFWLSAPRPEPVMVRTETEVATLRTDEEPAVVFHTTADLDIVPCSLVALATAAGPNGVDPVDRTELWQASEPFGCFSPEPTVGDVLYVGLSNAVPSCAVALRFVCGVEGEGVDPRRPPRVWEAWTGERWQLCELERDETGGFNLAGDVVLHVPAGHTPSVLARVRAGWLRCRVVPPMPGQPFYRTSPRIRGASAFTIGGTTDAEYAETVRDEIVGLAEGVPGQRFPLSRRPLVRGAEPLVVEVAEQDGWREWAEVEHFAESRETDRHFVLDAVCGEIVFGPWIRQADGSLRKYGAVPPKAAPVRVRAYRVGGGCRGNVARGTITALRSSLPFVARVENRRSGGGGVDGEDVDSAKLRAPLLLRSRQRAVTAADYEYLTREADPRVARAQCVPGEGADAAVVRVLVVPALESADGDDGAAPRPFEALRPSTELLRSVTGFLDERRVLGTRINVEPPFYRGLTAVVRLRARPRVESDRVRADALATLYRYLDPLTGGPEGSGWPFGRTVQAGELFAALQGVRGVEMVEEIRLYQADPVSRQRSRTWTTHVDLNPNDLPFSVDHYVEVLAP
jgi:predicted phage baseplate assembly protein